MSNSLNARDMIHVGEQKYTIFRLNSLKNFGMDIEKLPYSLKILLENLLRNEDGKNISREDIFALANWKYDSIPDKEISFTPARTLLQDFTGVPCIVDLAAMRDAIARLGGDPNKINPIQPVELVIDHSVQVDYFGTEGSLALNTAMEFERNQERYSFLKWGQSAFQNLKVVPPSAGIVHQVNLEYLARVVFDKKQPDGSLLAYPDTLVGTVSHTTMIIGLGVLGWGVGGIEAEAAMLGQPVSMLIPQVVGVRLVNALPQGSTATDLVLTVTEMLRKTGVVGKFVEFYGPGLSALPLADRATIANMAPEYGATCGIFPVDNETIKYLRNSGRSEEHVELVETYMKEQGLFHTSNSPEALYSETLELDLNSVVPSIAGPRRPQDRIPLSQAKTAWKSSLPSLLDPSSKTQARTVIDVKTDSGTEFQLSDGAVVIAAITSCTNTSNPSVMVAAGLLARNAARLGLKSKPWVKTSLAPGSRIVTSYLDKAGLSIYLDQLGFNTVGYGCTTCIGNSGPLPEPVSKAIKEGNLVVCSALSGNRNFEGRIQQEVRANYLMSPPLVVAYALVGRMDVDLYNDPLGIDQGGNHVYLKDIWPNQHEVAETIQMAIQAEMFIDNYSNVFSGDENWRKIQAPSGSLFKWDSESTYIKTPPYFDAISAQPPEVVPDIRNARVLAYLGDSITTDHISPAGSIKADSPAGQYLISRGVIPSKFNSYGSRRGHDGVMVRGTFANIRIKNRLAPGTEGGVTTYLPTNEIIPIFDAAMRYQENGTPTLILAGKEYGSGSSRDWAAKGPFLQGVKAVLAESYERIHRSNLVGMGILPLQFIDGQSVESLKLSGREIFSIEGLSNGFATEFSSGRELTVITVNESGERTAFKALARIDTPVEALYYKNGGILQYALRQLLNESV